MGNDEKPSPPRARRRRERSRAKIRLSDVVLSSVAVSYALLIYFVVIPTDATPEYSPLTPGSIDWSFVSWIAADVAAGLSLLIRRRWPQVLAVTAVTAVFVTGSVLCLPILFYTLAAQRRYVWAAAAATGMCTSAMINFLHIEWEYPISTPMLVIRGFEDVVIRQMMPFAVVPLLVAVTVRVHRQQIDNLRALTGQLEREQELVSQNAVLTERARIARDMHDSVTHYVGLIVLRAGALELTAGRKSTTGDSAHVISDLGRRAMQELRDLLFVLRVGGPEHKTALTRAGEGSFDPDVAELLSSAEEAGMPVTWTVDGALGECALPVRSAVYRIAQEALSNAARHAPGATVTVRVTTGPEALTLVVSNPVLSSAMRHGDGDREGLGLGLVGMNERVASLGGAVTAGATEKGEFQVQATIPLTADRPQAPGGSQVPDRPALMPQIPLRRRHSAARHRWTGPRRVNELDTSGQGTLGQQQ